jgi:glycerol uptake facilitator protein
MKHFFGELIGTFILVFVGCGSVAVAVLYSAYSGLFQVAAIWGIGVMLAIYASRGLSCAHLNPAVSIAFVVAGRMSVKRLPVYLAAQFCAAFLAAALLYVVFGQAIAHFESVNHIVRGTADSIRTAMMFGEYFPNPAFSSITSASMSSAFMAEATGTFFLAYFAGWGKIALPGPHGGWFSVYILAPVCGATLASLFFRFILQPLLEKKIDNALNCCD